MSLRRRITEWFTSSERLGILFVLPALVVVLSIIIYPILDNFRLALYNEKGVFIGSGNYRYIFEDPVFWNAIQKTAIWVTENVTLCFATGLLAALLVQKIVKGRGILTAVFLIPYFTPVWVSSLLFLWLYHPDFGALNDILKRLHLISKNIAWLGTPSLALHAVAWGFLWHTFPYIMVMLLAGLQTIPVEQYDAAAVDGASSLQTFRHITIPNLMPVIRIVIILLTIWSFRAFTRVQIMTAGGPVNATTITAIYVFRLAFRYFRYETASAAATIVLFIVFGLALIYMRFLRKTEVTRG